MSKNTDKIATWFVDKFSKDPSKMLVWTGVAGWILSSTAQIAGVLFNSKFSKEEKSFMIPQEMADAGVNIGTFLLITQGTRIFVNKLFKTGKIAPKKVHAFIDNHKILKNKKGKIDLNLDEITDINFPKAEYDTYKDMGSTLAIIGASVLSSNIITPVVRNQFANKIHKNYLDSKKVNNNQAYNKTCNINYNTNLKI